MSRVDVIVPCYQYGHFLRACVESVLTQVGFNVRVLVLDDASYDQTAAVAAELAARDQRVTFRRHPNNQGHIATYNEGLEWASSDYTLLLDADDVLMPGALARAAGLMDAYPEVGFTYGRAIVTGDPGGAGCQALDFGWRIVSSSEWVGASCGVGGNLVPTPTAVVRTKLLKKLGGYRKELPHAGDMELWLRLAIHAPVGILEADQAYYRRHETNMSSHYVGLGDLQQRKAVFDILFAEHGPRIVDWGRLRELACRRLAEDAVQQASRIFVGGNAGLCQCRELLAFALDVYPPLRIEPTKWRFPWEEGKQPGGWTFLRRILGTLRWFQITSATGGDLPSAAKGVALHDPGFEVPAVGSGNGAYVYNPITSPWIFSNAGVAGNGSRFTHGNPAVPQGNQVAFLQGSSTISQAVVLSRGPYTISFLAAQRAAYQASAQTIQVLVDGQVVGTFTPSGIAYTTLTTEPFTAAAGMQTLAFQGLNPHGGDNTSFIGQVQVNQVS